MEGGDDGAIERVVDSKDLQQQSKAFDKLTDRVEDRQLDSTRVQEVLSFSLCLSEIQHALCGRQEYAEKQTTFFNVKLEEHEILVSGSDFVVLLFVPRGYGE